MKAYLDEADPEVVAKELGIDLIKIRNKASMAKKETARMINLEAQVRTQTERLEKLEALLKSPEPLGEGSLEEEPEEETEEEPEKSAPKKLGRPRKTE